MRPSDSGPPALPGYSILTSYSGVGVNLVSYVIVVDDIGWLKASRSRFFSISSQRLLPTPSARWKECLATGFSGLELCGELAWVS